ncbi:MAG TPA: cadherin-like beta sandwich domain-containing protein [Ruminiclostridium sp.]|nr:cadherin-like beta sandwich domain-containing protein [Ruminiclostridium sp.]
MAITNVALNKTAVASTFIQPFSPLKAVDGNLDPTSRWVSQVASGGRQPNPVASLTVDLGATMPVISSYKLFNMAYAGWDNRYINQSFTVATSQDNINWTTVDTVTNNASSENQNSFSPVISRYVKVTVQKGLTINPGVASILDFQVMGTANTYLKSLVINGGTLTTPFTPFTNSLSATASSATDKITLVPTAFDSNLAITVNGTAVKSGAATLPINLSFGNNNITIISGVGTDNPITYMLNIVRQCNYLSNLALSEGSTSITLSPQFSSIAQTYTAYSDYEYSSINVTPTAILPDQETITVNGSTTPTPSGTAQPVNVNIGDNNIPIDVKGSDGTTFEYVVTVTRASSPLLTSVIIGAVTTTIDPANFNYSFNFSGLKMKVTLYAGDPNAKLTLIIGTTETTMTSGTAQAFTPSSFSVRVSSATGNETKTYQFTKQ